MRISTLSSFCSILLAFAAALPLALVSHAGQAPAAPQAGALAGLQLPFVENRGQVDSRVAFYAPTFAGTAFVTWDGALVLGLRRAGSLVEQPVGTPGRPQGIDPAATRVSIITDHAHEESLATFAAVSVPSPWAGVGLSYRAHGDNVERIFSVAPGADARAIRMQVRGAESLSERAGALVAHTRAGDVTLTAPVAYQTLDGLRRDVSVSYRIQGDEYGFVLGAHDPRAAVVIDPLLQGTYLAGDNKGGVSQVNSVDGIALGPNGDLYVAGVTDATTFPGTTGGVISAFPSNAQISLFVARMSPDLKQMVQATYYGFSGMEFNGLLTMAVDPNSGNVYVLDNVFCSVACGALPGGSSGADTTPGTAFVAEFNPALTRVLHATYAGGSGSDFVSDLKFGPSGTVYVAGSTTSTDIGMTTGGAQSTVGSTASAFVTEFSSDLGSYVQSTYLGDGIFVTGDDPGDVSLAIASTGDVYVAGTTSDAAFPGVAGGAQGAIDGTNDEFVSRLSGDLTAIEQSTYLGHGADEFVASLLVAPSGDVYATTHSADATFTASTGGALSRNKPAAETCVVTRLSKDLTLAKQSTFIGGSTAAQCAGAAVDGKGDLYEVGTAETVSGSDVSVIDPFGFKGGVEPRFFSEDRGGTGFVLKLKPDLTGFVQGTYFGGTHSDSLYAVIVGADHDLYVAGSASSNDVYGTLQGFQSDMDPGDIGAGYLGHFTDDLTADPVQLKASLQVVPSTGDDLAVQIDVADTSRIQPATGVVLTFHLSSGVRMIDHGDTDCTTSGNTVTCEPAIDDSGAIITPGGPFITDFVFSSASGSGAGTMDIKADQKLAAGSTASISLSASGGGGGSGGSSSGGGGNFGLLLILGLAGFVARRRHL